MAVAQTDEEIRDEVKYFDTLYDFASIIMRLNESAFNGETKQNTEKKICRLIPAFTLLCGADEDGNAIEHKRNPSKGGRPKKKEKETVPEPKQEEPEQIPNNFMKENEGWGLCPVCRKKMVKLTSTTRLIDFPAYCKGCKAEYVVSWWNVDKKEIEYTRYVNNTHYVHKGSIRNEAMKGTGVKAFVNSKTSATERVAMHL